MTKEKFLWKNAAAVVALAAWSLGGFAQTPTMYVMKDGMVVFQSVVSGIDSMIFYHPDNPAGTTPSEDALVVQKTDGSAAEKMLLDNVSHLAFAGSGITVLTRNDETKSYSINDVARLGFETKGVVGIDDVRAGLKPALRVYPNPTTGLLCVSTALTPTTTIVIYDAAGQIVGTYRIRPTEEETVIDISHLANGLYFVKTGNNVIKVIKQ